MNFILEGFFQAINLLADGSPETYSAIWATVKVFVIPLKTAPCRTLPKVPGVGQADPVQVACSPLLVESV